MSKIRNSLGLIVLDATIDTFPNYSSLSFAEYKAKTGIDLDDLFGYDSGAEAIYMKNVTKLIAIKCLDESKRANVGMAQITYVDGDPSIFSIRSLLSVQDSVTTVYLDVDVINRTVTLAQY